MRGLQLSGRFPGAAAGAGAGRGRAGARVRRFAAALLLVLGGADLRPARALDTDVFTGNQPRPNVLIVFDNSGSMAVQAYNTWPTTIYTGTYAPGTVYTRCKSTSTVSGGDVTATCTCRNVQTAWVIDQSPCAASFVDLTPPPSGDDTDDRESRRKRGNRLNFEASPPKNCVLSPFQSCTTATDCPGTGNSCAAQPKITVAKNVMTSMVNDPENAGVRFGLAVFDPPGIDYTFANYGSATWVTSWQANSNVYQVPIRDMDATNRASLVTAIGGLAANGATPTTHRLIDGWKYFNGQATAPGFGTSPVQQTCQRNYMLMVTDGMPEVEADYNTSPQSACPFSRIQAFTGSPGDHNGDGKEDPASPNWVARTGEAYNCGSDYLDDAMIRIRGMKPLGNPLNQVVGLFAVSFGFDYCQEAPAGSTDPGAGSLLWRASQKYGGGRCLSATRPDELDAALRETINVIKNDAQSFVAPVVPVSASNRTESGDRVYVALFSPRTGQYSWPGNVKKYGLDRDGGAICNASAAGGCSANSGAATTEDGVLLSTAESFWDASTGGPSGTEVTAGGVGAVLQRRTAPRAIYTYAGAATGDLGGVRLADAAQAFAKTNAALTPAALGLVGTDATAAKRDALIDYVHGADSYDEDRDGNVVERRKWLLGDIVHSSPLVVPYGSAGSTDALVLVGANDGMLHAFDDATGVELWAFVPPDVLPQLNRLRPGQSGTHPFLVDGPPRMRQLADGRRVVVFGLGRGGRAYYGLDVTNKTDPRLLWRVTSATSGFAELGLATSTPVLTRWANGGAPIDVAVFGGGLDPVFDDPAATSAGLATQGRAVFAVALATGSKVAMAQPAGMSWPVAGDMLAFDVNGDGVFDRGYVGDLGGNLWRIADDFSAARLFTAGGGRRIFTAPDAVVNAGSVTVYFGTGDRANPMSTQTADRFYAVRDDGAVGLGEASLVNVTGRVTQPGSTAAGSLAGDIRAAHGWYLELASPGEKVLVPPTIYFNVAFTTFTPTGETCQAGGTSRLYLLDPLLGGPTADLVGTSGGALGGGAAAGGGTGSGPGGQLAGADRSVVVGGGIATPFKVAFGNGTSRAFFGVSKGGSVALQPLQLPQIPSNVIPVSWKQVW